MSSDNGLIGADAFRKPGVPYYLQDDNAVINQPTLVSNVTVRSADGNGAATMRVSGYQAGAPYAYTGAINLSPGASSQGPAADGLTIRAIEDGVSVEIGTDAQAVNQLFIAGPDELSQVYDEKYNPVIKLAPVASYGGSIPENTGVGLFQFTPLVSGAYMMQFNVNIRSTDSVPLDGVLEWNLTSSTGEVQFSANTIKSTSMSKATDFNEVNGVPGALADPLDYTFSDLCYLTAGVQVQFNFFCARQSAAGGGPWEVANFDARLIQMC